MARADPLAALYKPSPRLARTPREPSTCTTRISSPRTIRSYKSSGWVTLRCAAFEKRCRARAVLAHLACTQPNSPSWQATCQIRRHHASIRNDESQHFLPFLGVTRDDTASEVLVLRRGSVRCVLFRLVRHVSGIIPGFVGRCGFRAILKPMGAC